MLALTLLLMPETSQGDPNGPRRCHCEGNQKGKREEHKRPTGCVTVRKNIVPASLGHTNPATPLSFLLAAGVRPEALRPWLSLKCAKKATFYEDFPGSIQQLETQAMFVAAESIFIGWLKKAPSHGQVLRILMPSVTNQPSRHQRRWPGGCTP